MKQYFGMSQTGNLKEAAQGVHAPGLLILMSNADQFEAHVTELESLFPGVPSIGCIGMSYSTRVVEKGVGLVAFYDNVTAVANVLEQASTMPHCMPSTFTTIFSIAVLPPYYFCLHISSISSTHSFGCTARSSSCCMSSSCSTGCAKCL